MAMLCPKCVNPMTQYERNGVTIDQCTECKGIFLDRGELEQLLAAEQGFYDQRREPPPGRPRHYEDEDDYERAYRQPYPYDPKYERKRRRRSFLENLFDD